MKALINAHVLTPEGFRDKQSILFRDGLIVAVCDDNACPADITVERDLRGMTLLPGFIDIQVNGGGGILFNDSPTVEGIKAIGEAHRKFGTTGFLPTLISDNPDSMASILPARFITMQDQLGEIRAGLQADFVLLSPEQEVMESWIRGQVSSQATS